MTDLPSNPVSRETLQTTDRSNDAFNRYDVDAVMALMKG